MDSPEVKYVLSLQAIRDRAKIVGDAAKEGKLNHFDVDQDRLDHVVDFVISVIERDFGPDKYSQIPPHGRWQHFEVGGVPRVDTLMAKWRTVDPPCDDVEVTRRLIDLFFVSVLLDAGAGDRWRYVEGGKETYERSEGIAVASLHMFESRAFTAEKETPVPMVDGKGLEQLTAEALAAGFQVSDDKNPMLGIESRAALLRSLGSSLLAHPEVFGPSGRPGNLVDYMMKAAGDSKQCDVLVLWDVLQTLLIPIWPKDRTVVGGVPIGDAWPLKCLGASSSSSSADHIQPFHKLTQWLTYSLMVPFQRVLGMTWINADALTALPEYRNGGLFVDLGVLTLKKETLERGLRASGDKAELPLFDAGDDVIVEWRAMTLVLIDLLYGKVLAKMGESSGTHLSMAQLLEAGTWKSGREVAAKKRPGTKSSPILINSDGTVF